LTSPVTPPRTGRQIRSEERSYRLSAGRLIQRAADDLAGQRVGQFALVEQHAAVYLDVVDTDRIALDWTPPAGSDATGSRGFEAIVSGSKIVMSATLPAARGWRLARAPATLWQYPLREDKQCRHAALTS
jgi:hypothetical protein